MRYIAFTICLVAAVTLVFFLHSIALSPQLESVAQIEQFEPAYPIEPVTQENKTLKLKDTKPCPGFPMPTQSAPLDNNQMKVVVKPNDKIDYKLIIIDPCSPSSISEKNREPKKKYEKK